VKSYNKPIKRLNLFIIAFIVNDVMSPAFISKYTHLVEVFVDVVFVKLITI